jgi:hypothetical protein
MINASSRSRPPHLGHSKTLRSNPDEPRLALQMQRALLEDVAFRARYARRRRAPGREPASAPPGTLAAAVSGFRSFYALGEGFFPHEPAQDAGPLAFAARVLARDHDAYHVLCEYETSDHDEIALQSLLCAQSPGVFAAFVAMVLRCPDLIARRYKHLRDLLDAELDLDAVRRGQRARPLLGCDCEALALQPLATVRRSLQLGPREERRAAGELRNSCGGKRVEPFFDRAVYTDGALAGYGPISTPARHS